jgi:type I restriction enzyme M protein
MIDVEGFCKSSTKDEIEKNNFILTPGRYVGFTDEDDDGAAI